MRPFVVEHYHPEPKRKSRRNEFYEREGTDRSSEKNGQ
jgi:hypothetical protein